MNLHALTDFNLVARYGGFGRAANISGRPKATLSRRVSDLETELGIRLFDRGSRILKLTDEGTALFERTNALLKEIDEAVKSVAQGGSQPRGKLRISAPLLFSQTAMGKLASEFCLKYPEVSLEVTTEDRNVDMIEEDYDLVIRVNPRSDENLVGRIFLHDKLVVVGSPGLKDQGNTNIPAVVRTMEAKNEKWLIHTEMGKSLINICPVLSLGSLIMVRDAVLRGLGIGMLPVSLVSRHIRDGRLLLWGDVDGSEISLWVLYPSRRLLSARVSAFLDYLKEAFPKGIPDELTEYLD